MFQVAGLPGIRSGSPSLCPRIAGGKIAESWVTSDQPAGSSFLHQTNDRQVRNQPAEKVADLAVVARWTTRGR